MTEVKFENGIDRRTAIANPRQIERVVRGAKFDLRIVYDVHNENEMEEDFTNLAQAMALLQMDYLGGHGTRGSGRVKFNDLTVKAVDGRISSEQTAMLQECLVKGVN